MNMNKDLLTSHIKDIELKQSIKKVLSVCEQAMNSYTVRHTKFLTPNQIDLVKNILTRFYDIKFEFCSLNEMPERQIAYFYPPYMEFEEVENVLSAVKIEPNNKDAELNHRDYLGSILSLGVDRENIGDIVFDKDIAYVPVVKPMDVFLQHNLQKIKNTKVSVSVQENLPRTEIEFEERMINVPSMRLDAVVSGVLKLSREKAQNIIQSGLVRVNFEETKNNSKQVEEKTILSIRGFGKYKIDEFISETKKKRLLLKILKYSN